jgi:hypothetical protein
MIPMYRLSKDIIGTIAYYDVLEFPLSAFETWKHLITLIEDAPPSSYFEVMTALRRECASGTLQESDGFYFLPGRKFLVRERIQKEKLSVSKLKRVKRLARIIRHVPYVRFIGATGSLSLKHGHIDIDRIDLFAALLLTRRESIVFLSYGLVYDRIRDSTHPCCTNDLPPL